MTKLLAATLLAATVFAAPGAIFTATTATAATCGIDAPAAWERPGGFCDQLRDTQSLTRPSETPAAEDCIVPTSFFLEEEIGARLLVAAEFCDDEEELLG